MELTLKNFIKVFVLFILVDIIWIKFIISEKYNKMMIEIQNEEMKIKILPAILVYVCMTFLLILFSSDSNIKNFLLGFLTYGLYDLTNLAIINKFNAPLAFADMTWGGILFAIVTKLALKINY
jgi:uncharacterized membrane protein